MDYGIHFNTEERTEIEKRKSPDERRGRKSKKENHQMRGEDGNRKNHKRSKRKSPDAKSASCEESGPVAPLVFGRD
jgi:hypothetical protein